MGWLCCAFGSRKDRVLETLALRQQVLALHRKRPHRRLSAMQKLFWVFLQRFWSGWQKPLVLVTPRIVVKWHRAGFRLLEVALEGTASRRPQACRKRDTRTDLSYGCRESDVGSTPDPRRTDEAWLQSLRADRLAMAPASSQKPRSVQALADIPAESPRGYCGYGLLHRADAHVWYLVLLLRDQSRPAENSAFQCHPKPRFSLDCSADARGMAVRPGQKVSIVRS